ncbi:uncharacterized protein LOC141679239 [Apium graveolens]|uniref:uncharacterized protein LOC141679239 n=1 Tax=Apium graveolens TaxID=4045 RepID=UPI003D7A8540
MRRSTGTIPEDLIRDILLRLPSETVVELKLVCKSWLALILSPNFAKAHLTITTAEEKDVLHIVRTYVNGNKSTSVLSNLLKPKFSHRKYDAQDCVEIYFEVYSSNTNAWRKLGDNKPIDLPYKFGEFHVTVNTGLLCWATCYGIIAFDLHTEVLTCNGINYTVPTFDGNMSNINNYNDMDSHALVTNFKDSIAVIIYKRSNYQPIYKLNLWALDNVECLLGGGIDASWTLIFNIDVNLPIDFVQGYLNSGDLLLDLYQNSWYLYNLDNKEARYFTQSFYLGQIYKYSKSLFTIAEFKQVNWNAQKSNVKALKSVCTKVKRHIIKNRGSIF